MPQGIIPTLTSFFGAVTGSSVAATVLAHITVAAVSMVGANLMAPKLDFGNVDTRTSLNVRGRNQRSATTNRQYIYGQVKVGGTVAYMGTSGTDNEFLHMVLVHCDHEVEELGDLYVNGELIPMASGSEGSLRTTDTSSTFGSSLADRYNGSLYIADHLGGPSQTTANSTLDTAVGADINSSDAFRGMAYTYIRMELKQGEDNAFPSGIPQFQRVVKGMKVYDPREAGHDAADSTTWEYSSNWALCTAHFLQSEFGYGRYGLSYDEINETELTASANDAGTTIDEFYTAWSASEEIPREYFERVLDGWVMQAMTLGTTGGTAPSLTGLSQYDEVSDGTVTWRLARVSTNSALRYELNGMVDSHEDPIEVLRKMKTAASGMVEYVGGEWIIRSGRYIAPTITLSESDFASGISGTTKDDRTNSVNTIKGVIADKHDYHQVIDVPSVTNSTFVTEDGGLESTKEMQLLFTNSHKTAQRLFKIELNKSRQSISHRASFTSKAMQLQVGDTFQLNFAKYGYSNKIFEVWSHQLVINNGALEVQMDFRETALDPAPNTTLPSPFDVPVGPTPTITSGTATLVQTADGTISPTMHVDWTPATDANVIAYELRWERFSGQHEYMTINGQDSATAIIGGVVEGDSYDVEIRCITSLKIGAWGTTTNHTVVGKSAAPTAPTGFAATAIVEGVKLSMDEHPDIDFKQFLIFQNTTNSKPGSHSYVTTDTTKTITGLTAGQQYYFWLEAEDTTEHTTAAASGVNATPTATAAADVTGLGDLATQDTADFATDVTGSEKPANNATNNGTTIDTSGNLNDSVNVNSSGALKVGKTSSASTTSGFWLGTDGSSDYDFHIGNTSKSFKWDGSAGELSITGDVDIHVDNAFSVSEKILATGNASYDEWQGPSVTGAGLFSQSPEGSDSSMGLLNVGAAANTDIDLFAAFTDGTYASKTAVGGERHFDIEVHGYDGTNYKRGGTIQIDIQGPVSSSHTYARSDIGIFPKSTSGGDDSYLFTPTGLVFTRSAGLYEATLRNDGANDRLTADNFRVAYDLTIDGRLYDGQATPSSGTSGQVLSSTGSATEWIDLAAGQWSVSGSDIYYTTGNVGIGQSSPSYALHISESSTDFAALIANSTSSGNGLKIDAGDNSGDRILQLNDKDGNEKLRVSAIGRVGVNNSSPSAALDVTGELELSSHATLSSNLYLKRDSDAWTTTSTWLNVGDYGVINHGGAYALVINGNGYRNNSGQWSSFSQNSKTGASQIWQYPAGYMTFNANTSWATGSSTVVSERMRIHGDGSVSIGTTSGGSKLRVNGTTRIEDVLTLGDVGSEGGHIDILDHNNTTTNKLSIDVDSAGNGRVFNLGNGDLKLGNLTGGTGDTEIYCNAALKIHVKSTEVDIADDLNVAGDLDVTGIKNFRIAHPVRDSHDLRHTCVESPQADLTYRGAATLIDGTVQVDLDSEFGMTAGTFAALNEDVQVFVQNESGWDGVRGSVNEGVLTINCEDLDSTDSVGWLVIGRRTNVTIELEPQSRSR